MTTTDTGPDPDHTETETHMWSVNIPDHPARQDSPEYVAARKKMNDLAAQATGLIYGPAPFEDHHGSALWLQDSQGWFLVRNLAGIEWSAQFCLAGNTRVLTADLRWVPIGDVLLGQMLMGFDEEPVRGQWRKWRPSEVLGTQLIQRPCYDLTFDDGTTIRASAEHKWLVGHGGAPGNSDWVETERLRVAGRFSSKVLRLVDTWEEDKSQGAGYLAAAFDGEGCLVQVEDERRGRGSGTSVRLEFAQRPNQMLDEVRKLLDERGFDYRLSEDVQPTSACYHVALRPRAEIMRFLGSIRPRRILPGFDPSRLGTIQRIGVATLVKKTFVGTQDVVALSTSTRTFVAEGLASHNCADPAKVDLLRQNAKRLYDLVAPAIKQQLDPNGVLDTPITDAAGVATWTDSIFNAGLPLQASFHIGVLQTANGQPQSPAATDLAQDPSATGQAQSPPATGQGQNPAADQEPAGVHHYPTPVVDIQLFKYDDFQLWVTDDQGNPAAVAPVAARGSGDARVHVLYATPGSKLAQQKEQAESAATPLILGPEHPLAKQAFQQQQQQQ
jgi:hypothetical protein